MALVLILLCLKHSTEILTTKFTLIFFDLYNDNNKKFIKMYCIFLITLPSLILSIVKYIYIITSVIK
jgi:hypothetical protein